jgi:hypothetical protein
MAARVNEEGESAAAAAALTWAGTIPEVTTTTRKSPVNTLAGITTMPVYNIRNGNAEDIRPYLQRSTVPDHYKWVKIIGLSPENALECVDASIKAHFWQIKRTAPADLPHDKQRKAAIMLGTARAVMIANYDLKAQDFLAGEVIDAPIGVTRGTDNAKVYPILTPEVTAATVTAATHTQAAYDAYNILTGELVLSPEELGAIRAIVRSAQAIIPVQGYNLMTDGHHYLSAGDKSSFRAFHAVEKQIWIGVEAKTFLEADREFSRDIMWHKAGHPVEPHLKMRISTHQKVADNLVAAGLGSAATRLPAVESEMRPIETYVKLSESVKPTIEMYGGILDNRPLHDLSMALKMFPLGVSEVLDSSGAKVTKVFGPYFTGGRAVTVGNREDLKVLAKQVIDGAKESMALCYGYYSRICNAQQATGGTLVSSTLLNAYSLKKLRDESPAQFNVGFEMAGDYQAFRAKKRNDGQFVPPEITFQI